MGLADGAGSGGGSAMLLVPALLWLREPERAAESRVGTDAAPLGLLRIPALGWIAASGAILNFALYSFSSFLPAFLKRYHGLSVAQAGLWTGIGSGVAGVLGAVLRESGEIASWRGGATDACCWPRARRYWRRPWPWRRLRCGRSIGRRAVAHHAGVRATADVLRAGVRRYQ